MRTKLDIKRKINKVNWQPYEDSKTDNNNNKNSEFCIPPLTTNPTKDKLTSWLYKDMIEEYKLAIAALQIQPVVRVGIEPGIAVCRVTNAASSQDRSKTGITVLQIQPVVRVGIEPGECTVFQIQPVVRVGTEPGGYTVLQIQPVVRVGIEPGGCTVLQIQPVVRVGN